MTAPKKTAVAPALDWTFDPGSPAVVTAPPLADAPAARAWIESVADDLRAGLDQYGALYLRNLPVRDVDDFAHVRDAFIRRETPYREKATKRSDFGNSVYSSTDLPAAQRIRMHNENSYTMTFPGLLLFGCLVAPGSGGATPVADCREVLSHLPEDLVRRGRDTGWLLWRTYSDDISLGWRTAFNTTSPDEVARYCGENGIDHEWLPDGRLRTRQHRSAIIRHPRTGQEIWFNHLAFWNQWSLEPAVRETLVDELGAENLPFNTTFGDGEPIDEADARLINAAYDAATTRRPWSPGDLLVVDNLLAAHGRDAFRGDRRIVVAMGEPVDLADCAPTVAVGAR
ncbi:TauD/TfdA family dioxygenase [Saccharothrix australiensis]|uniref:TfdA family taurine catabolism dioxygenase TauD n=1 Tax=Saccharothrix australiensis TaxID=2072 RepID=A0A495W0F9_9PSEU|nr:TauD/TfdA family dioxygenase [Saccharothrix australiensis]RKT54243.1 TfdA family taurine catabolism dioxygenase TauD [Saccharothrix australiensis]